MRFFFLLFLVCICHFSFSSEEEKNSNNILNPNNFCSREDDESSFTLYDRDQILLTRKGIITVTSDGITLSNTIFYAGNGKYYVDSPVDSIKRDEVEE